MKQINFENLNERNEFSLSNLLSEIELEFIKHRDKYLIKGSNGIIVDEAEKLKLENEEMIIQDFKSNNCQQETTKKIAKNKKKIKELQKEVGIITPKGLQVYTREDLLKEKITALQNKENADDTIKKTNKSI